MAVMGLSAEAARDAVLFTYNSRCLNEHRAAVRVLSKIQQAKLSAAVRPAINRVDVRVDKSISPLAWLCIVANSNDYTFIVGRGVETNSGLIVEGVWDGAFEDAKLHRSDHVYGSGVVYGKHAIFVPPKHCWEYLFVLHDRFEKRTYISNSFNFIFARAGIDLNSGFFNLIESTLNLTTNRATIAGIDLYDPLVVHDERYSFYRMMFYNFMADGDGNIGLLPSEPEASFRTYDEYKSFLENKMSQLFANGASSNRKHILKPITSISNGYDSICVSVLAKNVGLRDAITIAVKVKGVDDSGFHIAQQLGLSVHSVQHVLGDVVPKLALRFEDEFRYRLLEFVATAGIGDDVTFSAFEPHLPDRILLTGAFGDSIWRRNSKVPPGLPVRVVYGKSITEFRLRVGFAIVPVPSIGARFPVPIKKITRSAAMAEFTLWAPYDRPFPRRVIEEAGIARGTFARAKAATSPTPKNFKSLFRPALEAMIARYA